jgi:RNA polymerase sigma factor (sigma-70 family)
MTLSLSSAAATDERSLVLRVADGDRAAFESLMRQHNRRLYRLARATLRDDKEAEDALQDAYLQVWRSIGQFRGDAALSTWLSRLVLNACLARLRRGTRRQKVISMIQGTESPEAEHVPAAETDRPDHSLARSQLRELLERKLDALPEAFRVVFVLRSVEDMSVEEAALALDIPEATVRSRHFRAKSLLRDALAQEIDLAERDVFEFGGEHCNRVVAAVLARI